MRGHAVVVAAEGRGVVFLTGASGFVGARTVAALRAEGWRVRALVRPSSDRTRLAPHVDEHVTLVEGDITADGPWTEALEGCDAVIHAAAATGLGPSWARCRAVNIEGTQRVLMATVMAGVPRLVHISSLAVYGLAPGVYDEDAPLRLSDDPYGDTKVEAETLCRSMAIGPLSVGVLRPGLIVGPGDQGFTPFFRDQLVSGRFPLVAGGKGAARMVHVDDVARAVLAAVAPERPAVVVNVCAPGRVSWAEVASRLAAAMGVPPPRRSVPVGPLVLLTGLMSAAQRWGVIARAPLTRAALDFLAYDRSYPSVYDDGPLQVRYAFDADACVEALASAAMAEGPRDVRRPINVAGGDRAS